MVNSAVEGRYHSRWKLDIHHPLVAILVGFALVGGVYAWLLPPFEGPDEPQHFAYVEWLAQGKGFPPQGEAAWDTPVEQEAGQPPLYYLLASLPARLVGVTNPAAVFHPNPHFIGPFPRTMADNDNRALPYPGDARPLRGGWLAFYLARGLSLSFGLLLIISTYGLARQVAPAVPEIALAAAFLVAFTPQVLFISSVVSNDVPAAACSALVLWLLARLLRQEPSYRRAVVLGGVLGLATLTKVSTLALGAPVAAGLVWLWFRQRPEARRTPQSATYLILVATSWLIVAGWWYGRSWALYGAPFGLEAHDQTPWAITDPSALTGFIPRWLEVFRSFWLAYGWGEIRPGGWAYTVIGVFTLAAAVGWGKLAWRVLIKKSRVYPRHPRSVFDIVTVTILAILVLATLVILILLEMWMRRVNAPLGRLLFPAVAPIIILLVLGWQALHRQLWVAAGLFLAALSVLAPLFLWPPAYRPPRPLTAEESAALPPSIGWRFGEAAELIHFSVLSPSVEVVGSTLASTKICWRALYPDQRNYTVAVQFIGPGNNLIASRRTYPGLGLYPTASWRPGITLCDVIRIAIQTDRVPRTQVYKVEVFLFDEERNVRLPAYDAQGEPLGHTFVGQIRLALGDEARPAPIQAGDDPIQLLDYTLPATWRPGEQVRFTLEWGAPASLAQDYQLFVHLRDPLTGRNVAQADGPPLDGWYPTSWWPAGEIITDERVFPVPEQLPVGEYNLVVGWYVYPSGERLGGEFPLGTIQVVTP